MSTSGATVRWPQRARRSAIQAGVFAVVSTPRTMRPEKRPHRSGASTATRSTDVSPTGAGAMRGGFSGAPVSAATSRAMPKTLRPWPRFGVSLSVKIVSSSCRCWRRSAPTGAASSRISRPPWSSESLSSRAEQSMPRLSTPRILPTSMRNGLASSPSPAGGSSAPTRASGTLMPARTFGAPQTISSVSPPPAFTWQTRSLSAFGCLATSSTSATTTPWNGGAAGRRSSTSSPAMVRRSASSAVEIGGSQNSRSQDSGNCMGRQAAVRRRTGGGSAGRRRRRGAGRRCRSAASPADRSPSRRRSR